MDQSRTLRKMEQNKKRMADLQGRQIGLKEQEFDQKADAFSAQNQVQMGQQRELSEADFDAAMAGGGGFMVNPDDPTEQWHLRGDQIIGPGQEFDDIDEYLEPAFREAQLPYGPPMDLPDLPGLDAVSEMGDEFGDIWRGPRTPSLGEIEQLLKELDPIQEVLSSGKREEGRTKAEGLREKLAKDLARQVQASQGKAPEDVKTQRKMAETQVKMAEANYEAVQKHLQSGDKAQLADTLMGMMKTRASAKAANPAYSDPIMDAMIQHLLPGTLDYWAGLESEGKEPPAGGGALPATGIDTDVALFENNLAEAASDDGLLQIPAEFFPEDKQPTQPQDIPAEYFRDIPRQIRAMLGKGRYKTRAEVKEKFDELMKKAVKRYQRDAKARKKRADKELLAEEFSARDLLPPQWPTIPLGGGQAYWMRDLF